MDNCYSKLKPMLWILREIGNSIFTLVEALGKKLTTRYLDEQIS